MAILSKVTGFWDGFSFVKNVKKMREALIEYFKEEGIACEIKDGSLLFEYDECHYTVNFAAGDDYAECGIIYSIEDEAYTALELGDKTFIAAKTNNEVDNHAIVYVYNESIKLASTFYFTSKKMMLELFIKHFNELRECTATVIELTLEHINSAQDAAEDANRPKRVGFCVSEQNENVNGNDVAVVAKK